MATEYLPNELLAYAFDSFDRDSSDDLEDVIENFYADGAVHDAKTLIWQKYKEQLPKWQDRRGNNAKRREVVDILSAIKTIDQQYSNGDVQPYVFVAVKLKNIPNERYSAEMSVRRRLSLLEKQMADVLTSKLSYAATAVVGGAPAAEKGHKTRTRPMVPGQPIHRVDHDDRIPGLFSQQTDANHVKTVIPPADGSEVNLNDDVEDGVQTVGGANFTTVTKRRRKQTAVYGNANDDTFTARLQKHELFVFQVNKNVTEDQVKDYINNKDVTVVSIKLMTAAEAPSNSYHVVIHCMDVRPIMKPEFWPTGVGCRRFRKKQQWSNSKQ